MYSIKLPNWTFGNVASKGQPSSSLSLDQAGPRPGKLPTVPNLTPLHYQHPSNATPATKIRLSVLATAMVDALGGPAEFRNRFSFKPVTTMIPNRNFGLPPGVWTDDTSMMLCLAHSLTDTRDHGINFDERHQLETFLSWYTTGEFSATDDCFDIGATIRHALHLFQKHQNKPIDHILREIEQELGSDRFAGNGSLMRVLPIGLVCWQDEEQAKRLAERSSRVTHPTQLCIEACQVWTGAIVKVLQAVGRKTRLSKLDVLEHFSTYPYSNLKLSQALTVPTSVTPLPSGISLAQKEGYYWLHHPLLQQITEVNKTGVLSVPNLPYPMPETKQVPSTGYVLDTLVAALYCFMSTQTFEEGALMAVNMGHDADTVGAVYAGIAGVWYAELEDTHRFWSKRVREWREGIIKRDLVEQVADKLVAVAERENN